MSVDEFQNIFYIGHCFILIVDMSSGDTDFNSHLIILYFFYHVFIDYVICMPLT